MSKSKLPGKQLNQKGMAAIVITMVTMVVISLIVLGFATISRREQRQSIDHLLASQAFYAAESGVEDVRNAIRNWQIASPGTAIPSKDRCLTNNPGVNIYPDNDRLEVDTLTSTRVTCLKVNSAPGILQYDDVADSPIVVPIDTGASQLNRIRITWRPIGAAGSPNTECPNNAPSAGNRVLTQQAGWTCDYSILRADFISTNNGGAISNLGNGLMTAFLAPTSSNSSGNINFAPNQPNVVAGDCNTPAATYTECQVEIRNIPATSTATLRLSSLYRASNISIEALDINTSLAITGAQVEVDATGKAADVLRRIKVRIPVSQNGSSSLPSFALATNSSICKRFSAGVNYFNIPNDITEPDDDPVNGNPMCQTRTDEPAACVADDDILLATDRSTSMDADWDATTRWLKMKEVARTFIDSAGLGPTANRMALIQFGETSETLVGFTDNTGALKTGINNMVFDDDDNDTLYLPALNRIAAEVPNGRPASRKVVVFISDGAPFDNKTAIRNAALALKTSGVAIFTIGIGDPLNGPEFDIDEVLLNDMAGNGGTYTNAERESDLVAIIAAIASGLNCP